MEVHARCALLENTKTRLVVRHAVFVLAIPVRWKGVLFRLIACAMLGFLVVMDSLAQNVPLASTSRALEMLNVTDARAALLCLLRQHQ